MTTRYAEADADLDPCLYDPKHCEPDEPSRRPSNRVMALRLWAAIFVRGNKQCAWCDRKLTKAATLDAAEPMRQTTATIDHLDNDDRNNKPENLVSCCVECNRTRGIRYETKNAAARAFNAYLKTKGTTLQAAQSRVRVQTSTPIVYGGMRFSPLHGRAIVTIWAPRDKANKARDTFARNVDKLLLAWRGERIDRIKKKGAERSKRSRQMRLFEQAQAGEPAF